MALATSYHLLVIGDQSLPISYLAFNVDIIGGDNSKAYSNDCFTDSEAIGISLGTYFDNVTVSSMFSKNYHKYIKHFATSYGIPGNMIFISINDLISMLKRHYQNIVKSSFNSKEFDDLVDILDAKSSRRRNDQDFQDPSYQILYLI